MNEAGRSDIEGCWTPGAAHSAMVLLVTVVLACLATLLLALAAGRRVWRRKASTLPRPPGPRAWPVIGNLHLLGRYQVPFQAFTALAKVYGDVYRLALGATPCVIVNSYSLIKEVLITKGGHFGGRPDFLRFHQLFGGDRNNSLALCDWSELQKTRRSIARIFCSPRLASTHYDRLEAVCSVEVADLLEELGRSVATAGVGTPVHAKQLLNTCCANMFTHYMCSARFGYSDAAFRQVVRFFDEIFWEINQGYAVDFLPWLAPAYSSHMGRLSRWAQSIREFILARIVDEHRRTLDRAAGPRDFTDALLLSLDEDPLLSWEHVIFELEDFLGGHSAIGNLVTLALAAVVRNPEVGQRIYAEAEAATGRSRLPTLSDKASMPYTEATILETLRTSSSPIVPHVATQDTSIAGYAVEKGTVVFLNNYELNTGDLYWTDPEAFRPERFLTATGSVVKPEHFIPFSTGKRTCIGQRLVQSCAFVLLASLLQTYDVSAPDVSAIQTFPACVAVPPDSFALVFTPRV